MASTSAFLLVRPAFGLPAAFLARPAFFADFSFLALRGPLVAGASAADVLVFSESMLMLISPWPRIVCSRHIDRGNFGGPGSFSRESDKTSRHKTNTWPRPQASRRSLKTECSPADIRSM